MPLAGSAPTSALGSMASDLDGHPSPRPSRRRHRGGANHHRATQGCARAGGRNSVARRTMNADGSSNRGKVRRIDFSPDEFLSGVHDLTLEQIGAYWMVCSLIYSRSERIPNDDHWIARFLRVDIRKWRRIKAVLLQK